MWQEGRLAFEVKYLPELEVNKAKHIHFAGYQLRKRQQLVSKEYTHMWALAYFLAAPEEIKTNIDDEIFKLMSSNTLKVLTLGRLCLPKFKTHNLQTNLSYQFH